MEAGAPTTGEQHSDASAGTLGDVLYADKGQTLVPEREWVALVRAAGAGDEAALHALFERTNRIVFTLIVRITQSRESAEELTLDVFHDVWRRAATYDPASGTVVGWIMNQARSRAIDRLRFENRKKRVNPYADQAVEPATDPRDTMMLDAMMLDEQSSALRSALEVLTADERVAIETAFFADMTYAEVAASLNEPLGTIKTRVRSGLAKLRKELAGVQDA